VLLALVLVTGCGGGPNGGRPPTPYEVEMPDGRIVQCVAVDAGGLSCEWNR